MMSQHTVFNQLALLTMVIQYTVFNSSTELLSINGRVEMEHGTQSKTIVNNGNVSNDIIMFNYNHASDMVFTDNTLTFFELEYKCADNSCYHYPLNIWERIEPVIYIYDQNNKFRISNGANNAYDNSHSCSQSLASTGITLTSTIRIRFRNDESKHKSYFNIPVKYNNNIDDSFTPNSNISFAIQGFKNNASYYIEYINHELSSINGRVEMGHGKQSETICVNVSNHQNCSEIESNYNINNNNNNNISKQFECNDISVLLQSLINDNIHSSHKSSFISLCLELKFVPQNRIIKVYQNKIKNDLLKVRKEKSLEDIKPIKKIESDSHFDKNYVFDNGVNKKLLYDKFCNQCICKFPCQVTNQAVYLFV